MSKFLLAAAVAFAFAGFAPAAVGIKKTINNTHNAAAHAAHKQHLETALKDIGTAHAAAKAGNVKVAEQAAAAAMQQIHSAMKHHANNSTLHHHHHTHLTAALHDLSAAEKLMKNGNIGKAEHDLHKAATQVKDALKHHHV